MSASWTPLIASALIIAVHLVLYLAILRHKNSFRTERGIFLYHIGSFATVCGVASILVIANPAEQMFISGLAAIALHGIYSMSLLELWSLSQISYSIAILDAIDAHPKTGIGVITATFAATGQEKKISRLSSLQELGLLRLSGQTVELAGRGRLVVAGLLLFRWIANLRETG